MSSDLSLDVIKSTQDTLGQFVKKPPLSEKLLRKPPFRFLHDIITAVIKNTGFFNGLFTAEELNSENVKDREKKIAFLHKVIQVVNLVTDTSLSVRPSKIISGQEPEKTNELLQKIGEALINNLSSVQAVETITGGKKTAKKVKEEVSTKAVSKSKTDKTVIDAKVKDKNEDKRTKIKAVLKSEPINNKSKPRTSDTIKKKKLDAIETRETKQKSSKEVDKQSARIENIAVKKTEEAVPDVEISNESKSNSIEDNASITNSTVEINETIADKIEIISPIEESSNKIVHKEDSIKNQSNKFNEPDIDSINEKEFLQKDNITSVTDEIKLEQNDVININITTNNVAESNPLVNQKENLNRNDVKNKHNDKADDDFKIQKNKLTKHDKLKSIDNETSVKNTKQIEQRSFDNTEEAVNHVVKPKTSHRPSSVRPSSSRPGAPRFKDTNVDVILTTDPVCKAKVNIIAENYDKQMEDDEESIMIENSTLNNDLPDTNIDKIIIENAGGKHGHLVQQILETQKELDGDGAKVEIEWEWGARREREASFKEIEGLRNGLQTLSRAANPLGKLMDYVQEDVEIMRQELLHWRETRKKAAAIISQQENQIEKSIQPLEAKLKQLDDSISDQLELIYTVKSNIFRNDLKIKKILGSE